MSKCGLDDYFAAGGTVLDLYRHVHDNLPEPPEDETSPSGKSQATTLVAMAVANCDLFMEMGGDTAYATVTVDNVRKTMPLRGKAFRGWLTRGYYGSQKKAAGGQAVQDALTTLAGIAAYEGTSHPVSVRLGESEAALWLDLGTDTWDAVKITPGGWQIVPSTDVTVKFRRPAGMLPLPIPDPTGDLRELAAFTNRGEDGDNDRLMLIIGFLVGVFQQSGGRAVLELLGEAGSGKTGLGQMIRAIVDPNKAPLRTMPRDEGDLVIAAMNGIVCGFDNASQLRDPMSDAICRLTTGAGIGKRELYSDADEVILNAQRPVLLTGINSVVTRGDLGSRTVTLELPRIDASRRLTEAAINAAFERARPQLLGGLLHAVSSALRHRNIVTLDHLPRLADFVLWGEAAGHAIGWEPGDFAAAFVANQRDAEVTAIEALPVGPVLLRFMAHHQRWIGSASELLAEMVKSATDDERKESGWPKAVNRLAGQLRRLSPNLRQLGIWIGWERTGAARSITIDKNTEVWNRHHRHDHQRDESNPCPEAASDADDDIAADRHQLSWEPLPPSREQPRGWGERCPATTRNPGGRAQSEPVTFKLARTGDDGDGSDNDSRLGSDDDIDPITVDPFVLQTAHAICDLPLADREQYQVDLSNAPIDDPNMTHDQLALAIATQMLAGTWPSAG